MRWIFGGIFFAINWLILNADGEGIKIPEGSAPPKLLALGSSIDRAFHLALYFVIPVGIGMAIIGAIMWIMARDDAEKLKKAQMTITWAVVGSVFLVFVGGMMNLILNKALGGVVPNIEKERDPSFYGAMTISTGVVINNPTTDVNGKIVNDVIDLDECITLEHDFGKCHYANGDEYSHWDCKNFPTDKLKQCISDINDWARRKHTQSDISFADCQKLAKLEPNERYDMVVKVSKVCIEVYDVDFYKNLFAKNPEKYFNECNSLQELKDNKKWWQFWKGNPLSIIQEEELQACQEYYNNLENNDRASDFR